MSGENASWWRANPESSRVAKNAFVVQHTAVDCVGDFM